MQLYVKKADLRERQGFTDQEKRDLSGAWESGMTTTRRKDIIQKLSETSGISEERIKNWIGNQRGKSTSNGKKYIKNKTYKRGPSGYSLFASTIKKGSKQNGEYFHEVSSEWQNLSEDKKSDFNLKAKGLRETPLLGKPKDVIIMEQIKIIKNAAMILESVGYAIGGVGLDPKDPNNIRKGIRFFTSNAEKILDNNLFQKFENFFAKGEQENSEDKQKTDALRKKLRDHLNKSWAKTTGLKTNLPYSKIKNGTLKIKVGGLPEGLVFKEPSSYGYKTILKLLQADISFQIICSSNTVDSNIPEIDIQEVSLPHQDDEKDLPQNEIDIQEVSLPHQDDEKDLPQNDIDILINQIKRSSEETLASTCKKQKTRSSRTSQSQNNDEREVDKRKWYKVEKVLKKKGSRIYLKWADGSCSWEPSSSLASEDVDVV